MIGQTLGGYRIIEQVGMGGMATVFKAYDPGTDRHVAVKTLPKEYAKDPNFLERFRREAKAIARLEHLHILPVFAYGEQDDISYMVMRYLPTGTLAQRIRQGPLSFKEVSRYLNQLASALDYAHNQGVIHRDIKPSNALIDNEDNIFLTDFGIAKIVEDTAIDLTGDHILGTPQYMSPEQCVGEKNLTPTSDIYSLGIVLYEMVTGRAPFTAETPLAVIHMQLNSPLPLPRSLRQDLPEVAQTVILKALSKEPEARYQSCDQLARAFAQAIASGTLPASENFLADEPTIPPSTMQAVPLDTRQAEANMPTTRADAEDIAALQQPPSLPSAPRASRRIGLNPVIVLVGIVIVLGLGAGILAGSLTTGQSQPPTPTLTVTDSATQVADISAIPMIEVLRDGMTVRSGPSQDFDVLTTLGAGERLNIVGISEDVGWYQITLSDKSLGWVAASEALIRTSGDLASVPITLPPTVVPTLSPISLDNARQVSQIAPLTGYEGDLHAVAFNTDGTHIAASGSGNSIYLWEVLIQERIAVLEGHEDTVTGLAFSPDGTTLISGSTDKTFRLWDLEAGEEKAKFDAGAPITGVAYSPDGFRIAIISNKTNVILWDAETLSKLANTTLDTDVASIAFSPDSAYLTIAEPQGGLWFWDTRSYKRDLAISNNVVEVVSAAFMPTGSLMAMGSQNGEITLWNIDSAPAMMIKEGVLSGHTANVTGLVFSPDGSLLVTSGLDNTLRLWDVAGQREIVAFEDVASSGDATPPGLALSPDGAFIALDAGSNVRLWSLSAN